LTDRFGESIRRGARTAAQTIRCGLRVASSLAGGPTVPVSATYHVTFRCNLSCLYCAQPRSAPELDPPAAERVVCELARAGALRLGFSGGEPLLRDDLDRLVSAATRAGVLATVTTNGTLLADRLALVRGARVLFVSVDGDERIHDEHRGAGAFARAMRGLEAARTAGMRIVLLAVVTRRSASAKPLLALAHEFGVPVLFQPVLATWDGARFAEAVGADRARAFFRGLLQHKRAGLPVANSTAHLAGVLRDPAMPIRGRCPAGRIAAAVLPDGTVVPCCERHFAARCSVASTPRAVTEQLRSLERPDCATCVTIGNVELRRLMRLSPAAVLGVWKLTRPGRRGAGAP
jgi:MoaA/NifB/PqqE/SkfB family radical SAM enzyme